jgi:hypothetical protein
MRHSRWPMPALVIIGSGLTALFAGSGGGALAASSTSGVSSPQSTSAASLPPSPTATSPISAWTAWAQAQTQIVESLPFGQLVSPGYSVVSVQFVPVENAPGVPAGVTTTAAVVMAMPTAAASQSTAPRGATNSVSPAGFTSACNWAAALPASSRGPLLESS